MTRIAFVLVFAALAACGADGEPVRPSMNTNVGIGTNGVSVNTGLGVNAGPVRLGVGLGL